MQDFPDAPALLEAVAAYLVGELRQTAPREERFRVLVAANVCAVVAREIRAGVEPSRADLRLFRRLLGEEAGPEDADATAGAREAAAELAAALRGGRLDDGLEPAIAELAEHVARKLEVARPGYAG